MFNVVRQVIASALLLVTLTDLVLLAAVLPDENKFTADLVNAILNCLVAVSLPQLLTVTDSYYYFHYFYSTTNFFLLICSINCPSRAGPPKCALLPLRSPGRVLQWCRVDLFVSLLGLLGPSTRLNLCAPELSGEH